jgi:hypothetical protein
VQAIGVRKTYAGITLSPPAAQAWGLRVLHLSDPSGRALAPCRHPSLTPSRLRVPGLRAGAAPGSRRCPHGAGNFARSCSGGRVRPESDSLPAIKGIATHPPQRIGISNARPGG